MSLFYGNTNSSLTNRQAFLTGLGIDYRNLVCARQVHGSQIRYIQDKDQGKGALSYDGALLDTDALVTDRRNLPLAIFTADCLSVFFYDPKAPAVGLAHAGWRSTKDKIAAKTIQFMHDKFATAAGELRVGFGPVIRDCCYMVGEEFTDLFLSDAAKREEGYYLDLAGINQRQILAAGVKEENIFDPRVCTSCQNRDFFSYRKEGKSCGRMMSVIMLR